MANVRPNHMGNYPDDVWPGDPRAPWNEPDDDDWDADDEADDDEDWED